MLDAHVGDDAGKDPSFTGPRWPLDQRNSLPTCLCNSSLLAFIEFSHAVDAI